MLSAGDDEAGARAGASNSPYPFTEENRDVNCPVRVGNTS